MYLNKKHTREMWKKEQHLPPVSDRLSYQEWIQKGKKSTLDYAMEKIKIILDTHKTPPLTEDRDQEISKILQEARKHYHERGLM